jgi:hypothetical protein
VGGGGGGNSVGWLLLLFKKYSKPTELQISDQKYPNIHLVFFHHEQLTFKYSKLL